MNSKTTRISGITVELDLYMECGEQRSDCTLSVRSGRKDWSNSLEAARYNGGLDANHCGEEGDEEPYHINDGTMSSNSL
jgi:hypothetical protein